MMQGTSVAARWRSFANVLTGVRLLAAPALAAAILFDAHTLALALFVLAVASDLLDGPLARQSGRVTPQGELFDHGSDALFVATGIAALAFEGEVTPWLAPAVALAFFQYALDSRGADRGRLRGSTLGRWNGIGYFVLLGAAVVREALALGWPDARLVALLAWLLLASTLLSMADRLRVTLRARQ